MTSRLIRKREILRAALLGFGACAMALPALAADNPGATGPLADNDGGGSFVGFAPVLDAMLKLDFDTAVPGAGEVQTKADVQAFRMKFTTVIDRARELVKKGVPKEQLLMQIKTDDIGWAPRIPQVDAFYAELSKGR